MFWGFFAAVFALLSATIYYFSGTAPGVYCIVLLTGLGILLCIFRRSYLRRCFSTTLFCVSVGLTAYKLAIFVICLFLGSTTHHRFGVFMLCSVLSIAVVPLLYPVFTAISNIGGDSWKE